MTNLMNDRMIQECVEKFNMIENFVEKQKQTGVISYGLDSFGYDMRIASEYSEPDYRAIGKRGLMIDPKDARLQEIMVPRMAAAGQIVIKPHSFVQVRSLEKFNMPKNVQAYSHFGKSTYARLGLVPYMTPIDAGYSGYITFSVFNPHPVNAVLYAEEGIAQISFWESDESCEVSYADKGGKYQGSEGIVGSKIKSD